MADERGWAVAWITGASGGIGAALVAWLAGQGVKIAATARDKAKLDALAAQHAGVFAYPADVTDPEALKAAAAAIERDMGPIDLAIAGAGVYVPFDIRAIDLDGFHRTMTVNVNGVANMLMQT